MGLIEDLGSQAGIRLRKIGGLDLVDFNDTRDFLDACLTAGVLVLGIEGFYLQDNDVMPDMNTIADFSNLSNSKQSIVEAGEFIKAAGRPEMLFDFTLSKGMG